MPLEAVMLAIDNSDFTRNGDYTPTRWLAQTETIGFLANAKLQENQESSVGLMTTAGTRVNVVTSPGREPGQMLNALSKVKIGGRSNIVAALKTAQLALKNRQNKNQRQRVILFVGSPIEASAEELVKLGKVLKKNGVAIDIVNFGTENTANDNTEKLEQLVGAVNSSDNSHLVSIPPGPHIFADLVLTSSIMSAGGQAFAGPVSGGGAAAGGAGGGGAGAMADMDPEMAMAIRMSMEEERQRQQKIASESGTAAPTTAAAPAAGAAMEDDEEALLAQAIAMSMSENQDAEMTDASSSSGSAAAVATPAPTTAAAPAAGADASAAEVDLAMQDPDFINSLLQGVPGAGDGGLDNLLDELTGAGSGAAAPAPKPDEKKDEKDGSK